MTLYLTLALLAFAYCSIKRFQSADECPEGSPLKDLFICLLWLPLLLWVLYQQYKKP